MRLKTLVPPGQPLVVTLACGGHSGEAALFAKDGQRIATARAEVEKNGYLTFHHYRDMPEGAYWSVMVTDTGVVDGRHTRFILVSVILVSQESGVQEISIGSTIVNFLPENRARFAQHLVGDIVEAGAPDSVHQFVRELYRRLS